VDAIQNKCQGLMEASIQHLKRELARIRTGRASTALLDDIKVEYYGTPVPISQVATVAVPEARMLTVQPWEESMVPAVERALLQSDLGITPSSDGKLIRLPLPPLTEERRKEFVKQVHRLGEEARVSLRNARRDAVDALKKQQKDGDLSEDDAKHAQDGIQKMTDRFGGEVDAILKQKDAEILEH
jgi:ribosome recycling factor